MRRALPEDAAFDAEDTAAGRILRVARDRLLTDGYAGLTMDALAHDLGMSKKTLYAHYAGKEAIVTAIIAVTGATIRRLTAAVLNDPDLGYAQRLHGVMGIVGRQFAMTTPALMRELQRFAPGIYAELDGLRRRNIPLVIGGLLRAGIELGQVKPGIDPDFAVEFWLQSINGLVHPDMLERFGQTPRQAFEKGIDLFFRAVLTEAAYAEFIQAHKGA
jgi:AcrR family transcriptional regulator